MDLSGLGAGSESSNKNNRQTTDGEVESKSDRRKRLKHESYLLRREGELAKRKIPEIRDRIKKNAAIWRAKNREKLREGYKKIYRKHKPKRIALSKKWQRENKSLISERGRQKRAIFQDAHVRAWYLRKWHEENKEHCAKRDSAYVKRNRDRITKQQCEYIRERRKIDIQYRITFRLRSRVWDALQPQSAKKAARTMELLGCDSGFFKSYLEDRFTPDMNWGNYGEFWQIDHIYPLVGFDLTVPENQKKAFHYTNCQPLSSVDNNFKADKNPSELDRYYTDPFYRIQNYRTIPSIHAPGPSSNKDSSPPYR